MRNSVKPMIVTRRRLRPSSPHGVSGYDQKVERKSEYIDRIGLGKRNDMRDAL